MSDDTDAVAKGGVSDRKIMLGFAGFFVLAIVIGAFSSCGGGAGRDEESYRYGVNSLSISTDPIWIADGENPRDADSETVRAACNKALDIDIEVGTPLGETMRELERDDLVDGCTDALQGRATSTMTFPRPTPPPTSTTVIYDPSTPVYTPPASPPQNQVAGDLPPTAQAILAADYGDCIRRIDGSPMADGRTSVEVSIVSCSGPEATDVVVKIYSTDGEPPCRSVWIRSRDVSPAKVLCLMPLR